MPKRLGPFEFMLRSDLSKDAVQTTAQLRINGKNIGIFTSGKGLHAEAEIRAFLFDEIFSGDPSPSNVDLVPSVEDVEKIDIFITRSPCKECTKIIQDLETRARLEMPNFERLRIFCASVYKGENNRESAHNIMRLNGSEKVRVYRWNIKNWAFGRDESALELAYASLGFEGNGSWRSNPGFDTRIGPETEVLSYKKNFGESWRNYYDLPEYKI